MSTHPIAQDARTPVAAGALALGAYCMLLAVVFYVPFALSPYAQQNDVFMTNLFFGLGGFVAGSVLVAVEAGRMAAQKPWITTLLGVLAAVVAFAGLATLYRLNVFAALAPVMAGYTVVLLAVGARATARHGHLAVWARTLALAVGGVGLVTLYYALFGGQYYDAYGLATYLPRFVDLQTTGVALLLGIAVFFIGRVWTRRA